MDTLGLYAHFPWCVRKCPYCDFNSHPVRGQLDEAGYLTALERDAAGALADIPGGAIGTVFFGGGTPSLFSPDAFARLIDTLAPWLAPSAEITLEANPGAVEHHDFAGYRRAGINRLSLGAQSFSAGMLSRLGRIHQPGDTGRALHAARDAGFDDVNLDVMYGLPEQTPAQALADLDAALALAPSHVSWYQLTIEPKTEFARRPPTLATEHDTAVMERAGRARLAEAGFERYEVSAYARPGRRCRHNLGYWTFGDYVGIGAGAHGKRSRTLGDGIEIRRTRKAPQPRLYLAAPEQTETVTVSRDERVFEFMMNALRLVEGVEWARFESRTGLAAGAIAPCWDTLARRGLVRRDRVAATELGFRYLDSVLEAFLS